MKSVNFGSLRELIVGLNPSSDQWLSDEKTDLFGVGALDSVSVIELIARMEKHFDFGFDFKDLRAAHFRNVAALKELLVSNYGFTATA